MDISFSDRSTILIGGLAFIFISLVNVNGYQNGKISLNIPEGNKKYFILVGALLIITGLIMPMDDSEHQSSESPVIINNDLTQTITSGQKESVSIEPSTLCQKRFPTLQTYRTALCLYIPNMCVKD
ncbi:hypothetical protein DU43_18355 [Methanosarcina mazei]|jgi:hypothetical protein|uniref:Uncharacterized protein n=1 Tax=Methanosarcina mazei TaxID=2209 RepID=A0A0F8GZQ1_METMZ|nr:hypothetical protein [Methanosarcina mazei]KKG69836.1 hypothetical protein DU43_18355 [Methanosarcina mazei]